MYKINIFRIFALGTFSIICSLVAQTVYAAYLQDIPQTLTQPDGTVLNCYASGDEFYNWLHDENGFTIIQDNNGFYVYAVIQNKQLVPSDEVAGKKFKTKETQLNLLKAKGLSPGINLSPKDIKKIRLKKAKKMKVKKPHLTGDKLITVSSLASNIEGGQSALPKIMQAPHTGTFNNLVVFIRCADQNEFSEAITFYDGAFNSNAISMDNYFQEASYNQLSIASTFYPPASGTSVVSYQDSHDRDYFRPYNTVTNSSGYSDDTELTQREHQLLADAVNAVSGQIPPDLDVDGDDDGYVDNVAFIIQGATDGWSSLLWPHRWALYSAEAYINGARVWDYNFQLSEAFGVSVLCHEMFHTIGAPDLYHYSSDGLQPIGQWDLMEYNTSIPQHMTAYMKYRYGGWINAITEITAPGTYLLTPLSISSTGSCYKIPTSNSLTESFVVEYRKKTAGTFDQGIPGSGLLVYRINTLMDGEGNQNGPPDEVYIFRPDGTASVNGSWTQAHFSSETGRTQINSLTNPRPFLSDGANGGLDISDIGSATDSIAFNVNMPEQEIAVFSEETNIASGAITAVNFGFTSPGSPIIKIFTVLNGGYGTLEMSDLSIPDGYSLIGEFPTNIAPNSRDSFQIQLHAASPGAYTGLIAFNTNDPDENPFSFPVSADVTCVQEVLLEITTDDFGGETTWELKDSQNNILFSGGPYASGQIFPYSIILPSGDYAFTIYDEYGDGICCDYGSGSYSLRNVSTGDVYIGGGGMFGNQETTPFSIEIDKNGDIDGNCLVELQDAILSLQLSSEITPNSPIEIDGDVNGDGKIGVAESIYVLEKISEKRE